MKSIFVFPDYTHLNGLGPWAFPGCRHGEERSNPTLNNEIKNNILLLTDCFSKGSEQAVPTNDGYPEVVVLKQAPSDGYPESVAIKQVPRNEGYPRDHFP